MIIILSGGDLGGESREVADGATTHEEVLGDLVYIYRIDRPKKDDPCGTLIEIRDRE